MREPPDLEIVNQTLSVVVQKQERELSFLRAQNAELVEALTVAANDLDDWGAYTKANAARAALDASLDGVRPCTCHPDDAPVPCQHRYALSECRVSLETPKPSAAENSSEPTGKTPDNYRIVGGCYD